MNHVIRFLAGGVVVSVFAILSDMLRPKSIAGAWCGALRLCLLTYAFWTEGPGIATEGTRYGSDHESRFITEQTHAGRAGRQEEGAKPRFQLKNGSRLP